MLVEWDEAKSQACFRDRGFDFEYAAHVFLDPEYLVRQDSRHEYGEARYQVVGKVEGRLFVVVYTPRSHSIRVIPARKANKREQRAYEHGQAQNKADSHGRFDFRPNRCRPGG